MIGKTASWLLSIATLLILSSCSQKSPLAVQSDIESDGPRPEPIQQTAAPQIVPQKPVAYAKEAPLPQEETVQAPASPILQEPTPEPTPKASPTAAVERTAKPTLKPGGKLPLAPDAPRFQRIVGKINLNLSAVKDTDSEITSTVIYFVPDGYDEPSKGRQKFEITTRNKRFHPSILAIPVGSEVSFPIVDKILHNVFSVSPANQFDLGLYSAGTEKSVIFDRAGIVYVHCNVHHSMQADILVLDTPWYANADHKGDFAIEDIPEASGRLFVWHPRSKLTSRRLESLVGMEPMELSVRIVRRKVPKHLNKFGKSYRPEKK